MLFAGQRRLGGEVRGAVQRGGEVALAGRLLAGQAARPGVAAALDLGVGAVALGVAFANGVLLRVLGADAQAQRAVGSHADTVSCQLLLHHLASFGRQTFHLLAHLRHLRCHVGPAGHAHVVLELPQAGLDGLGLSGEADAGNGDGEGFFHAGLSFGDGVHCASRSIRTRQRMSPRALLRVPCTAWPALGRRAKCRVKGSS